jgi:rod shape determining protein RodA
MTTASGALRSSTTDLHQARPTGRWLDLDWMLLAAVATLLALGAVLVYAATRSDDALTGGAPTGFLQRFVLNAAIGAVLCGLVTSLSPRALRGLVPWAYGAAIVGLLAVASPLGSTVNGSHSWLRLPAGFSLQPAELTKLAVVVALAHILSARRDDAGELSGGRLRMRTADTPTSGELLRSLAAVGLPAALVLLQPDLGTALVFVAITLGVLAVAGIRVRLLLAALAAAALTGVAAVQTGLLRGYQLDRLASFADPARDPLGAGYTTAQARAAIGSGGLTGNGLFHGPLTNGAFVPERHTDFVFTVAGEELGFLGAGFLIAVLGVLLWRALRIAASATDLFGRLVATGVAAWLAVQAFQNIGMALGLMPVTGLPLPFVSYSGSSVFACLAAIGLLQNVRLHATATRRRRRLG